MLARAIAKHLATVVDGLTFDADDGGGSLFVNWMPSEPDVCVAVMPSGGLAQPTKAPTDLPTVQVLVRGDAADPDQGYPMARSIYAALTCLDGTVLDENGDDEVLVIGCTAVQSDPIPLGRDDNDRPEWSLNFQARTREPTTFRP